MAVVRDYTALISGASFAGQGSSNTPAIVTYSFETKARPYLQEFYSADAINSYTSLTEVEKTWALEAIRQISAVSGVKFIEVAPGQGDMAFGRIDFNKTTSAGFAGFAYYPTRNLEDNYSNNYAVGSDVFLNTKNSGSLDTMIHEIGHALGLAHPFSGDTTLAKDLDNKTNTIMSYTGSRTGKLGQFDIDALQYLYGTAKAPAGTLQSYSYKNGVLTQTWGSKSSKIGGSDVDDVIDAGSGNDIVGGFAGNDHLKGGAGNDILFGGLGDDILEGGAGDDMLYGGTSLWSGTEGSDTVDYSWSTAPVLVKIEYSIYGDRDYNATGSSIGNDMFESIENIWGGKGADTITGDQHANILKGNGGADTLYGRSGNDTLYGGSGSDWLYGELGNDTLYGDSGSDRLYGGAGRDTLEGGEGNDQLFGENSDDTLSGGAGDDLLNGGSGADKLIGGSGSDTASYDGASSAVLASLTNAKINTGHAKGDTYSSIEHLTGSAYNDKLHGTSGANIIKGGNGNDTLYGLSGNDRLYGEAGNDTLYGGAGVDRLYGDDGNDKLFGEAGNDTLYGSAGDDILNGGAGADVLSGGAGLDTASYEGASRAVVASLTDAAINTGDATGDTYASIENLMGSTFNDKLHGNAGANLLKGGDGKDSLYGKSGNDILEGGVGNDRLHGGAGNDTLIGGRGDDLLTGGAGNDTFVFTKAIDTDTIDDFELGKDRIDLTAYAFSGIGTVLARASQEGADVELRLNSSSTVLLKDIDMTLLTADDFLL